MHLFARLERDLLEVLDLVVVQDNRHHLQLVLKPHHQKQPRRVDRDAVRLLSKDLAALQRLVLVVPIWFSIVISVSL